MEKFNYINNIKTNCNDHFWNIGNCEKLFAIDNFWTMFQTIKLYILLANNINWEIKLNWTLIELFLNLSWHNRMH